MRPWRAFPKGSAAPDATLLLVRQLQPSGEGLPIEVYAFTNDTAWGAYEEIQADIFDHILAIAPEFGLRPYQRPTGRDLALLGDLGIPE